MQDLALIPGASGAWPDVVAQDESAPGALDGTALEENWVTDLFGFIQAVVSGNHGLGAAIAPNTAPDTVPESDTVSQILKSIRWHCGNAGEVVAWMGPSIPAGMRLLPLDGSCATVANYPELVANTYCGNANNPTAPAFYRCTSFVNPSATRDTGGAYMKLPDCRGYFLRGIAASTTVDPEGARLPGAVQAESIATHSHDKILLAGDQLFSEPGVAVGGVATATGEPTEPLTTGTTGTGIGTGTANETRPDNIAVKYCIRY